MPEDSASLVVFLASEAGKGVTGQAIGIGGDRLSMWSHSGEVAWALREGGWSPQDIAESWEATMGVAIQPFGVQMPELDLSEG
jgi:3-oxoacyl-[acyl-carrier protein] reductase